MSADARNHADARDDAETRDDAGTAEPVRSVVLLRSALLAQFPNLIHGMSSRQSAAPPWRDLRPARHPDDPGSDGDGSGSEDARRAGAGEGADLRRVLACLELAPEESAFMRQEHGAAAAVVDDAGVYAGVDALITRTPQLGLVVRCADCAPLLLYAPAHRTIAAVHAGWRGIASGIVPSVLSALRDECGAEADTLFAWIGPSARGCCYDIGDDIADLFPRPALRPRADGGYRLDLAAALAALLGDAGVPRENIEADPLCTICHPALLHSHRRDGAGAGRMLAVCALRDEG